MQETLKWKLLFKDLAHWNDSKQKNDLRMKEQEDLISWLEKQNTQLEKTI